MSFSPQLFLAHMRGRGGPARPNRFKVILPLPAALAGGITTSFLDQIANIPSNVVGAVENIVYGNQALSNLGSNSTISRYLSFQCEAAELPGKSLQTADVKYYGPTFKLPYQQQYNDTSLTFLCTNDFYERKLFELWNTKIVNPNTNNLYFQEDQKYNYKTNIVIIQYDETIREIFKVVLEDAFPVSIAPQPLSWSDDSFHRLTVQFAYTKYRVSYETETNFAEAAGALFGTAASRWLNNLFE